MLCFTTAFFHAFGVPLFPAVFDPFLRAMVGLVLPALC
jgi:hypothetical protein